VWSLTLLGVAAWAVSAAALPRNPVMMAAMLALAVALVVAFVVLDRGAGARVLPRSTFGPGPLKWIYLTLGLLMGVTMVDVYAPLFGQRLGALQPAAAGFLGAALSVGWTVAEIRSAAITDQRTAVRVVTWAPVLMAAGLGLTALTQRDQAGPGIVAVWAIALALGGAGIGMAWPHLCVWAMGSADEPGEQAVAAAAINTVQLMCAAFGAGLAGVLVNLRESPDASSARAMFAVFAALAALGVLASRRAHRPG